MTLKELLQGCDVINASLPLEKKITQVAYDSRKVDDGCLFVAIKGEKSDGHDFISEAIRKGAVAIVGEKDMEGMEGSYVRVKDSRKALACITHNFYGVPSEHLTLIGITGTNGKTTTTYILKSILERWGKAVGLIGTISYMIKGKTYPAPHTTPESLEFHGLLKDMLLSGCTHVVLEVSSHALEQHRVDKAFFKVAIFTNLTRDHLDYHKSMENYFRAKERLFRELLVKDGTSVINSDDLYGRRLLMDVGSVSDEHDPGAKRILTYGLQEGADIVAKEIHTSSEGIKFKISFCSRTYDISSPLMGLPNVYNILSAAGAAISLGVPWQVILDGISNTTSVRGRFEKVDIGQNFLCIVDYAHTEDALERLIFTARDFIKDSPNRANARIITVFGCGGDRDRGKRPRMGEVATRLSDFVILTSDNPRSENPSDIIQEIEGGAVKSNYIKEPDRREAIRKAVSLAHKNDVILIAGKGHEDYQEIKGMRYKFNDREVLGEAIKDRLKIQRRNENSGCMEVRK